MRVVIVFNHPYEGSYCNAILQAVTEGLKKANHEIDLIHLDNDEFNPVMTANDLKAFRDKFISTGAGDDVFQVAKQYHLESLLAHPALSGVVVDSHSDSKHYISERLAQRPGAILPVISSEYYDTLIKRLITEKTISIDTTASGGNTSLMTLVEDDE